MDFRLQKLISDINVTPAQRYPSKKRSTTAFKIKLFRIIGTYSIDWVS